MTIKYKFFVGVAHQKVHLEYYKKILGGSYVEVNCDTEQELFPSQIFAEDGEDVVWLFGDVFFNLHNKLKGKQIYVAHGLGFKDFLKVKRVKTLNNHFNKIFLSGVPVENLMRSAGVRADLFERIGYPYVFDIPRNKTKKNHVLVSVDYFIPFDNSKVIYDLLQNMSPDVTVHLTIHPQRPLSKKAHLLSLCERRPNIKLIKTQSDLLRSLGECEAAFCGLSSVSSGIWYQQKPLCFVEGRVFGLFGGWIYWLFMKRCLVNRRLVLFRKTSPLFTRILSQSSKFGLGNRLTSAFIAKLKVSSSANTIFYSWNDDLDKISEKIRLAVTRLK